VLDFYSAQEAQLATDRLLEPRLRAAAAEIPQLQAQLAELRQTAIPRKLILDGASDALASAGLQSRIEELAVPAGVAIGSAEGLPAEPRGPYRRIGLRLAVAGTYESIVKLLGSVEAAGPPLVLDSLQIHGKPVIAGSDASAEINAGFVVYGFRGSETPTTPKP